MDVYFKSQLVIKHIPTGDIFFDKENITENFDDHQNHYLNNLEIAKSISAGLSSSLIVEDGNGKKFTVLPENFLKDCIFFVNHETCCKKTKQTSI